MRKSLLTLLTVLFTLSSAYAADIVEDWTTRVAVGPTATSTQATAKPGHSEATGIDYKFCKAAKVIPNVTAQAAYLSFGNRAGAYVEFSLPINCSEIKLKTSSTVKANAKINFSANGNTIETGYAVDKAGTEYTIQLAGENRKAGTIYRIDRNYGTPLFDTFTYIEAIESGSTLTTAVSDLAFATPFNGTQTKTIKGNAEGLTEDITVTVDNEAFSAPATLTAEALAAGFDVTFTGSEAKNYNGTITLKYGEHTATVAITAITVAHQGTEADPLTPADVLAMNNLNAGPFYIQGTISDKCADHGENGVIIETTVLTPNNIVLVGDDGKKIGVNLQKDEIVTTLNIQDNPQNVGKTVIIKGKLEAYLNTPGIQEPEYISGLSTTGIADIVADENAPVEYFNLQGIRVDNPENGLYIRRQGNKVTKVIVK